MKFLIQVGQGVPCRGGVPAGGNWYYATWPQIQDTLTKMQLFNSHMTTEPWDRFPPVPKAILPKDYVPASYREYFGSSPAKGKVWVVELKEVVVFEKVKEAAKSDVKSTMSGVGKVFGVILVGGLILLAISVGGKRKKRR